MVALPLFALPFQASLPSTVEVGPESYAVHDGTKAKGFKPPVYTVPMGGMLEFRTLENGSTAFMWNAPEFKPKGVLGLPEKVNLDTPEVPQPGEPMVGAASKIALRFRPLKPGRTEVSLSYEQAWTKRHKGRAEWVRFVVVVPKPPATG